MIGSIFYCFYEKWKLKKIVFYEVFHEETKDLNDETASELFNFSGESGLIVEL